MKIIRHFFTNIKALNTNIALFWFFVCSISITNGQALLTDFGTANAYQITYPANLNGVIPQGMEFTFRALNANTGASTLQVNGIAASNIVKNYSITLVAGDIQGGHFVKVIYDGSKWQMLSSSANPSTGTIGGGGTINGVAFFTNNSAITADGTNFSYKNGTYTDLSLGKIKISSKAIDGDNLAIGANAGNTTMAGTFNVMVGGSSGAAITSGGDNAFLGAGAGSLNTSGSSNSFFGSGAGNANSTGQFNTFIGNDAGSVNTSGSNLVVIGKGANVAANNLTNAIAIGANANVSGNNMMALGGTGTDAVKVGIGTGTPLNTLDVVGGARIRNLSSVGTNMVAVNAAGDLQIASAGSFLTGSGTTGQVPYFASSSALLGTNIFRYDGSNVAINTNPAGSYLFQVLQNTSSFPAIYGENDQFSGVGIWGYSSNASGQAGVRGVAVGTGYGVYGSSSGTGYGVFGANSSTGPGVYGQNTSGGIAGFFDAGGTGVAGFFSGRVGIGVAAPAFSLVSRTSAVATTAETLAQFDVSDGGGSYLQIKNATSVNSTFEPVIEGNLVGSNNSFVIRGVTNNDAAGAPLVQIDSKFTSSALTTKPLFGVSNNGTQYLSIGPTGVTRVNNLSGTGGAVFANTSGDLFVSTTSGISGSGTVNGVAFFTNNNTITADGTNFNLIRGNYTSLNLGKITIRSTSSTGDNLAIGTNAGNTVMTGTNNSFYGIQSGLSNSTGADNSFYGANSGISNTLGNQNVFLGTSAGQSNTSGTQNTFIGSGAANSQTTGSNNIALGYNAQMGAINLTNAIAIGSGAIVTGSNSAVIGAGITGLGINVGAPTAMLDVNGGARIRNLSTSGAVFADANGNLLVSTSSGANAWTINGTNIIPQNLTNNVGIGTNAPNSRLHIVQEGSNATIRLQTNHDPAPNGSDFILARSRNTTAAPALLQSDDRIGSVIFQGYDGGAYAVGATIESKTAEVWASGTKRGANIIFNTVNLSSTIPTEKMRITANGNVGIGTTIPGSLFSVGTNAGFNVNTSGNIISINGLNARFPLTQGGASTFLQNDGTGNLNWVAGGVTSQWTTNASNIYFNTGNVGLGIIAPLYKLHIVESNATANYSPAWITFTSTGISGGNPGLNVETFGNATAGTPLIYGVYAKATLRNTFSNGVTGIYGEASKTAGNVILTGVWGESNTTNNAENYGTYGRAFGSSLANYGITGITSGTGGANNYGGYFQANSTGTNNYGIFVTVAGVGNKYAAVFNGGPILIGTLTGSTGNMVTAASALQNTIFATTSNAASDAAGVRGENTSASGDVAGVYGRAVSNSNFAAGVYGKMTAASSTGQTYAIYGSHDGNGTFSAGVRGLHNGATGLVFGVQGVVSSNNPLAAAIAGIAPATGFGGYFDGKGYFSGNVGIGTTAPGTKLDVVGTTNIQSGKITKDGTDWLDGIPFLSNYMIGQLAGNLSMSGGGNFLVGSLSGNAMTTGFDNLFIGSNSGRTNTTGRSNVFVGTLSGFSNLNGIRNTFIGPRSGQSNNSGNDNIFIGNFAGNGNISGSNNIYMGNTAGSGITGGQSNIMMGIGAGSTGTTGNYNVFLGDRAGYSNSGNGNIFVGTAAGYRNLTGNNNIAIGNSADFSSNNFSNSIAIGAFATVGGSNMMMLGGVGTNAVNVGIGTNLPSSTLHVNGSTQFGTTILGAVGTVAIPPDGAYTFIVKSTATPIANFVLPNPTAALNGRLFYIINNNGAGTITFTTVTPLGNATAIAINTTRTCVCLGTAWFCW